MITNSYAQQPAHKLFVNGDTWYHEGLDLFEAFKGSSLLPLTWAWLKLPKPDNMSSTNEGFELAGAPAICSPCAQSIYQDMLLHTSKLSDKLDEH